MWTRSKKLSRWLRVALVALLLLPIAGAAFVAVVTRGVSSALSAPARELSAITLADLQADTGLSFPAAATITHFVETPPVDPVWRARVAMAKGEEQPFLDALAEKPATPAARGEQPVVETRWWRPARVIQERVYDWPASSSRVTVLVSDEAEQIVAYIEHAVF